LDKTADDLKIPQNYLFYLATPPTFFGKIIEMIGGAGLNAEEDKTWRRVIIEKPFGHDLESAIELNTDIKKVLAEKQIYRIDHYLGKETVQNLLVFRFANGIFEPIWNRRYIDSVQITVSESLGVELRGNYYDTTGALRDMIPNHIFQLLSYIAMEPPISLEANAIRDEKAKVLRAVRELVPESVLSCCVRGQYGPGIIDGVNVPGYRSEKDVRPNSPIETYVAMKLMIDNWRWEGVPFYIRTGKRLAKRITEIAIQFKRAPSIMFHKSKQQGPLNPDLLIVHIQPEEGISLRFGAKIPGPVVRVGDVNMTFKYEDYFGAKPGTGYETLLYDCMMGDGTLFQRDDMVISAWRVVEPVLDVWNALAPREFPNYESGSWGPKAADLLLERDGRKWRNKF
ncbi:MAG: glucose-6-phosphate dehydrogenase, partial [bacterium]|nr:glucose-6-phosphate dehydrogenase [bacterium]